jgi:hypothetical protein
VQKGLSGIIKELVQEKRLAGMDAGAFVWTYDDPIVLIAITADIIIANPRVLQTGMFLISLFLNGIADSETLREVATSLTTRIQSAFSADTLFLFELWLHRITRRFDTHPSYKSEVLSKLAEVGSLKAVDFWDFTFIKGSKRRRIEELVMIDNEDSDLKTPVPPYETELFFSESLARQYVKTMFGNQQERGDVDYLLSASSESQEIRSSIDKLPTLKILGFDPRANINESPEITMQADLIDLQY